jgi:hypothetical protein
MALAREQLALAVLERQVRVQEYEALANPWYAYPYFATNFLHHFHAPRPSHTGVSRGRERPRPMLRER